MTEPTLDEMIIRATPVYGEARDESKGCAIITIATAMRETWVEGYRAAMHTPDGERVESLER